MSSAEIPATAMSRTSVPAERAAMAPDTESAAGSRAITMRPSSASMRRIPAESGGGVPWYSSVRVFPPEKRRLSSRRLPSNRIRPRPIRSIRPVRASMSCMSWVVRITVVPRSALSFLMKDRTAILETASRPMVGSSRNKVRGLWRRDAASSQRIRWPRLRFRAGVLSSSVSPSSAESSSRFRRYSGTPTR